MKGLVRFALVGALIAAPVGVALGQQAPQQAPPSSQGGPSSQVGQSGALTVASDSLVGTKVWDTQGKEVGQISKLLVDVQGGKIASVMVKQGGSLGMGGKELLVPWEALKIQRGQNQELVATMQQPLLEQAPSASPPSGQPQQRRQ
jgi:sporulation protein YlmC with PRC-barrel domain